MSLWTRLTHWIRPRADFVSDVRHPTAWLVNWAMGGKTTAGVQINADSAMGLAAYYACVRNISEDVAKLPLITYKRLKPRGKERAPEHPAYHVLHDAPNPDMTAMTLREVLTHHAVAWGNGYAEIVTNARRTAFELYPIHPSRVMIRRNEQDALVYDVYSDGTLMGRDGQQYQGVRLRQEDVLHIKGLGTSGYEGYSVFRMAAESLGLTLAAQTFGASFFGNGASMIGLLEHPKQLSAEAQQRLRESWQETYGGPLNAGKVAILEEGMKYTRLGVPPEEAQYLGTREFQLTEICRWFRMPPHLIQDLSRAHFNNVEEENLGYVTNTLMPWFTRWEQELKRKLFADDPDYFAEHLVLGLLRGDMAKRAQYFKARFEMGTINQDEIREIENENPLPRGLGSHYWVATNNYSPMEQVLGSTEAAEDDARQQPFVPAIPGRNGSNGHAYVVGGE